MTVTGRRPLEKEGFEPGKSETCRASEWQSHWSGEADGLNNHTEQTKDFVKEVIEEIDAT